MPGFPGQAHAVHGRAARRARVLGARQPYGALIRNLRRLTNSTLNKEPKWRHNRPQRTTGYHPEKPAVSLSALGEGHGRRHWNRSGRQASPPNLVEMNWDPITRIVGSLGIFTKIDFENRRVAECHSTSSIFRGYSIFMKGKDPRDAHFITSRICGICGDNHATCSVYAQNMAYRRQAAARSPNGSSISAKPPNTCSTTTSIRTIWSASISANRWSRRRIPSVWEKAQRTPAPHAADHGYRTIADIMTRAQSVHRRVLSRNADVSRYTREMFSLMEGRHVHPSTLYPGGVGTTPTVQLFTDYLVRLAEICGVHEEMPCRSTTISSTSSTKLCRAMRKSGRRRILLGCWGSFQDPDICDYNYKT